MRACVRVLRERERERDQYLRNKTGVGADQRKNREREERKERGAEIMHNLQQDSPAQGSDQRAKEKEVMIHRQRSPSGLSSHSHRRRGGGGGGREGIGT